MRPPTHSTVRLAMACDSASKSNIGTRHCCTLTEAIGAIEKVADVALDGLFQRGEAAIVTGPLQPIDLALGEILIAAANRLGHVDILDVRSRPERAIGREHHVPEAARLARADIEDAAD